MPTLRDAWTRIPGTWRPADHRPDNPKPLNTWFGEDGNTVWAWVGSKAVQLDITYLPKEITMPEPEETTKPDDSPIRDADAGYRSSIHTEHARTLRLDAEGLDAGVFVELLRVITDRWPRAKMGRGGIVIPEEQDPATLAPGPDDTPTWVTLSAPLPDNGERPATRAYWAGREHRALRKALAQATGWTGVDIAQALANHGQAAHTTTGTIASFIAEHILTRAGLTPTDPPPGTVSYWEGTDEHHDLLEALSTATGRTREDITETLALLGQHYHTPTATIAALIRDQRLTKPTDRKPHFDTKEYWTTDDHLTLTRALADVHDEPLEYTARTLAGLTGGNRGPYGALDVYIRDRGRKYEWNTAAAWGSTAMNQTVDALAKAADIPRSNVISALIRHGQVCTTPAETVAAFVTGTGLRRP